MNIKKLKWNLNSTIIVAIIAFLGTITASLINGCHERNLESKQFEANLVLQALDSENENQKRKNLKFLLKAKLIADENGSISKIVHSPDPIDFNSDINIVPARWRIIKDVPAVFENMRDTIIVKSR